MTAARTGQRRRCSTLLLDARRRSSNAREKWYGETALHLGRGREPCRRRAAAGRARRRRRTSGRRRRRSRAGAPGSRCCSLGSWTPLMYAARENALDAGQALLAAQAPISIAIDPDGATALVIAIINANYDFAALLLDAGADPNVVDKDAAWDRSTPRSTCTGWRSATGGRTRSRRARSTRVDIVRQAAREEGRSERAAEGGDLAAPSHGRRLDARRRAPRRSCARPSRATSR